MKRTFFSILFIVLFFIINEAQETTSAIATTTATNANRIKATAIVTQFCIFQGFAGKFSYYNWNIIIIIRHNRRKIRLVSPNFQCKFLNSCNRKGLTRYDDYPCVDCLHQDSRVFSRFVCCKSVITFFIISFTCKNIINMVFLLL